MEFILSSIDISPYFNHRTDSGLYVFYNIPQSFREDILILLNAKGLHWGVVKNSYYMGIYSTFINIKTQKTICCNLHGIAGFIGAFWFNFSEA